MHYAREHMVIRNNLRAPGVVDTGLAAVRRRTASSDIYPEIEFLTCTIDAGLQSLAAALGSVHLDLSRNRDRGSFHRLYLGMTSVNLTFSFPGRDVFQLDAFRTHLVRLSML